MLVTKLKNKIRMIYVLVAVIVIVAAGLTVNRYGEWYYYSGDEIQSEYQNLVESEAFLENFLEMPYVL